MDIAEWLKNEDIQRNFRKASGAVVAAIYNEMYIYIWFICIYNIFLLVVVVINLYLLVRMWRGQFANMEKYIEGLSDSV
jgi:hypothetical protein